MPKGLQEIIDGIETFCLATGQPMTTSNSLVTHCPIHTRSVASIISDQKVQCLVKVGQVLNIALIPSIISDQKVQCLVKVGQVLNIALIPSIISDQKVQCLVKVGQVQNIVPIPSINSYDASPLAELDKSDTELTLRMGHKWVHHLWTILHSLYV